MSEELGAILRTIREVEQSLDRRAQRAAGVNLMIWGLASASIFVFYQLAEWNPAPYERALGPALRWIWLAPIAVGYVASALVGARLGRAGVDEPSRRSYRRGMLPGLAATAIAAVLMITGQHAFIPGALVATIGLFMVGFGQAETSIGRACRIAGIVMLIAGVALVALWQAEWTSLAAAVAMGVPLFATGVWLYQAAR